MNERRAEERFEMLISQYPHELKKEYLDSYLSANNFNLADDFKRRLGIIDFSSCEASFDESNSWGYILDDVLCKVGEKSFQKDFKSHDIVDIFIDPFVRYVSDSLFDEIGNIISSKNERMVSENFKTEFCHSGLEQLRAIVTQTLVLEVNIIRLGESDYLDTPSLDEFKNIMGNRKFYEHFFEEYSTLARLLVEFCVKTINFRCKILSCLNHDIFYLRKIFHLPDVPFTSIEFGSGDTHADGESVCVLKINDSLGLVFKPRSLQADVLFNQYLKNVSEELKLELVVPESVNCSTYGWQEYVDNAPCEGHYQFKNFYLELGVLLAVSYAFGLSDLHFENIIAAGKHPVLVDVETLFAPRLKRVLSRETQEEIEDSLSTEDFTVLETSILPSSQSSSEPQYWGASNPEGLQTIVEIPLLPKVDSLDVEIEYKHVRLPAAHNIPYAGVEQGDWRQYEKELISGFKLTYQYISDHKEDLVGEFGLANKFFGAPIRVVLKGTSIYSSLIQVANHPDYMRDGVEIERLFSLIWRYPSFADPRIWISELNQLRNRDIPYFSAAFGEKEVVEPGGKVVAKLLENGQEWFRKHISSFGEKDLERQLWFIRASFITSVIGEDFELSDSSKLSPMKMMIRKIEQPSSSIFTNSCCSQVQRDAYALSKAIMDRLIKTAANSERGGWYSISPDDGKNWSIQPVAFDLYGGTSGIGLALLYLSEMFKSDSARVLSRSIGDGISKFLTIVAEEIREDSLRGSLGRRFPDIGFYGAIGGGLYFLSHLSVVDGYNEKHINSMMGLVDALLSREEDENYVDIISGSAGLIEALRSVLVVLPGERAVLGLVRRHRDLLVKAAHCKSKFVNWIQPQLDPNPLVGYSHGVSGILVALTHAGSILNDEANNDVHNLVTMGLEYERNKFDESGVWPDLRVEAAKGRGMVAWCHGAPGVALARAQLIEKFFDQHQLVSRLKEDLRHAVDETLNRSLNKQSVDFNKSLALCHGRLGNIESLIVAIEQLADPEVAEQIQKLQSESIVDMLDEGLICGVPRGLEVPGLMAGISGMALSALRFSKKLPDSTIPLVLSSDIPKIN